MQHLQRKGREETYLLLQKYIVLIPFGPWSVLSENVNPIGNW
jgi:hypothetical protein